MIQVKLLNFRKWHDILFTFENGITKISGESGMGKSTIFEAIYWCLYGKIRAVKSKGTASITKGVHSDKTEVTIDMPYSHNGYDTNIQIHRSGMKSVLTIIGDDQYVGESAQSKIDEYFGSHDMFLMSSYLRAEAAHPLISASPSEKRELTALVFPDASKFDIYKTKLQGLKSRDSNLLSQVRNKILSSQSSIATLEESYKWISSTDVIESTPLADDRSILSKISDIKRMRDEILRVTSSYNLLQTQLSSLPEPVDISPYEERISQVQEKIMQCTVNTMTKDAKVLLLQEKVVEYNNVLNTILSSLGYQQLDTEECTRIIKVCTDLLNISGSLSDLESQIKKVSDDYAEQSSRLIVYERSLEDIEYNLKIENVLECPCCHSKLQHTNQLVVYNGDTKTRNIEQIVTPGDVEKLRFSVQKLDQDKQKCIKSHNLYQDLLNKESQRYKNVPLHSLDIKVHMNRLKEYQRVIKSIDSTEAELKQVLSDNREYITKDEKLQLERELKELNSKISQSKSIEYTRKSTLSQIAQIENTSDWIRTSNNHIESLEEQSAQLQKDLQSCRELKDRIRIQKIYLSHKKILLENTDELSRLDGRMISSAKLEHILASSYNEYVGEKLKEIEYDVSILGKCFFDDTMNITLTPGKETSTGGIRPSFDINVEYGGTVFEDVKAMSTGERKRLSIILMIILTKYTDGKIMLLDEALTSVGLETRGIIMNEIQRLGIPIFLTSHDEIPMVEESYELDLNRFAK